MKRFARMLFAGLGIAIAGSAMFFVPRKAAIAGGIKPFGWFKIKLLLLGFAASLLFSPPSKAQSEINPDHFDGTAPWEIAGRKPVTSRAKPAQAPTSHQTRNNTAGSGASLRLVASANNPLNPMAHNVVAVQDKRKTAVRKSDKK